MPLFLFQLQFFDGWELDGKYFPNEVDHEKSLSQRSHEFCTNNAEWPFRQLRKRFRSSQNAALLQYRIPSRGSFVATVKFIENPERKFISKFLFGLFLFYFHRQEMAECWSKKECRNHFIKPSFHTMYDAKFQNCFFSFTMCIVIDFSVSYLG